MKLTHNNKVCIANKMLKVMNKTKMKSHSSLQAVKSLSYLLMKNK